MSKTAARAHLANAAIMLTAGTAYATTRAAPDGSIAAIWLIWGTVVTLGGCLVAWWWEAHDWPE